MRVTGRCTFQGRCGAAWPQCGLTFRQSQAITHAVTQNQRATPTESLGVFELMVMLATLRLRPEEAYTVSIANDIAQRTGRTVRRANVFTTLARLEAKGLVSSRLGDARPERGGRARRLVTVEPAGLDALRVTTQAIRSMIGGLGYAIGG